MYVCQLLRVSHLNSYDVVGTKLGNRSPTEDYHPPTHARRERVWRRYTVGNTYVWRVTGNAYAVYIDAKLHTVREHVTADHVFD